MCIQWLVVRFTCFESFIKLSPRIYLRHWIYHEGSLKYFICRVTSDLACQFGVGSVVGDGGPEWGDSIPKSTRRIGVELISFSFSIFFVLKLIDSVGFATPWLRCFSHQSSREHLCMGIRTSFQLPNCKLNGFDVTFFFLNGSESGLRKFCEQEAVSSGNFAVWELRSLSWRGLYFMSWDFLFRSRR